MAIRHITSKSNDWFKRIRELASDNTAYRTHQQIWLEGDHLCHAALNRSWTLDELVLRESLSPEIIDAWSSRAAITTILPDPLMNQLCSFGHSSWIGGVVKIPNSQPLNPNVSTVVLDRLQDPGNAGSILRSAAAFGFKQVATTPETVALWSSKVVRSAMGAHFGIEIFEAVSMEDLMNLGLPVLVTSSHEGQAIHELVQQQQLPQPCLWVMGHEGQGASLQWFDKAFLTVRIDQPGGEESLNVAAAAAICLHASASQTR